MADDSHELTLYVQSKKAVTTFFRPSASGASPESTLATSSRAPPVSSSGSDVPTVSDHPVFFLSDDQARCQAMVEEIAAQRGYLVKVVDIEKVGRLERLVTEHLRGVQSSRSSSPRSAGASRASSRSRRRSSPPSCRPT
jgi:hypothetical protein